ncbi:MAG: hypothetical protein JWN98_743, partial [Abditibacteriota bacterium]|nr:hypothetical protein [Abditibacteriota bacterium]
PPALSSAESADAMRSLFDLYLTIGDTKYLDPLPSAVAWLRRSMLAPSRWARFYELSTNRPLYFTREYQLVYTDDDLPTHYSFQNSYGVPNLLADYEELQRLGREAYRKEQKRRENPTAQKRAASRRATESHVREVIAALDDKGRWLRNGRIESDTFIKNAGVLSDYLQ